MLLRPGQLPQGAGWAFEVKWDGFRAIVSTEAGLDVRRAWKMTNRLSESLPLGLARRRIREPVGTVCAGWLL